MYINVTNKEIENIAFLIVYYISLYTHLNIVSLQQRELGCFLSVALLQL